MSKKIKPEKQKKIIDSLPLGCCGNKKNELKILLPIIRPQLTKESIFIEPFCGSAIVSFSIFKEFNDIYFHINDTEEHRINFFKNMINEEERNKLYKIEKEIIYKGQDFYNTIVKTKDDDYLKYIISRRIHSFRYGLYPTTKKIILHEISNNWINFLNKATITNNDYLKVFDKYKDNENAFLYLDPPYMDSYNASYSKFQGESHDEDFKIIDNTIMYIHFLDILKNGKCKILFSINDCALTNFLYKDFIKESYNHLYQTSQKNDKEIKKKKKNTNVLIISNF